MTSGPRVTLEAGIVTLALLSASRAVNPHGAVVTHSETTLALFKSAREWMPSGLPGLVTISSELRAKITGFPSMSPAVWTVFIVSVSAEAKTSAGAPCWIWVASVPEDPKLNVIVVPGWAAWNCSPS